MVSVSVNSKPRSMWSIKDIAIAHKVASNVLDGIGVPSTDVMSDGLLTIIVRRQCTDFERKKVVEKYLQS